MLSRPTIPGQPTPMAAAMVEVSIAVVAAITSAAGTGKPDRAVKFQISQRPFAPARRGVVLPVKVIPAARKRSKRVVADQHRDGGQRQYHRHDNPARVALKPVAERRITTFWSVEIVGLHGPSMQTRVAAG